MRKRKRTRMARMTRAMMYFLYFFQMKNTKVFMGFTNQLKDVLGRLRRRQKKRDRHEWRQRKLLTDPYQSLIHKTNMAYLTESHHCPAKAIY